MKMAVVVAHPDDEVLFAGGLLARVPGATVVCCTTPRRDPERIEMFRRACAVFDAVPVVLGHIEPAPSQRITNFDGMPDLRPFDLVVTHNRRGEYGSKHHQSVCAYVLDRCPGAAQFGYGGTHNVRLDLRDGEWLRKLEALQCYDHTTDIDKMPKWQALVQRYFAGDLRRLRSETYAVRGRLPDARADGPQAAGRPAT